MKWIFQALDKKVEPKARENPVQNIFQKFHLQNPVKKKRWKYFQRGFYEVLQIKFYENSFNGLSTGFLRGFANNTFWKYFERTFNRVFTGVLQGLQIIFFENVLNGLSTEFLRGLQIIFFENILKTFSTGFLRGFVNNIFWKHFQRGFYWVFTGFRKDFCIKCLKYSFLPGFYGVCYENVQHLALWKTRQYSGAPFLAPILT